MGQDVAENVKETIDYGKMFQPRKDVKVIKKVPSLSGIVTTIPRNPI